MIPAHAGTESDGRLAKGTVMMVELKPVGGNGNPGHGAQPSSEHSGRGHSLRGQMRRGRASGAREALEKVEPGQTRRIVFGAPQCAADRNDISAIDDSAASLLITRPPGPSTSCHSTVGVPQDRFH